MTRLPSLGGRIEPLIERVEAVEQLDEPAGWLAGQVTRRRSPALASALSGTWLGHPLHPLLTDLPIGFWTSAWFLDLVGGRRSRPGARTLVGLGVLSAVPTAAAGISDWADTEGRTRRIGMVHAAANSVGLTCYALSWVARRRGRHGAGVMLAMAGAAAATVGGHLGGHLVYRRGTGVDVNEPMDGPGPWEDVVPDEDHSAQASAYLARVGGEPVLVSRAADGWHAIGDRCSHRGGPLHEGTVAAGCVTCPWHASQFRTTDGAVLRGPATAPQPRYEVRGVGDRLTAQRVS